MNRDFEFKQLLRAYRSGVISEAMFEAEIRKLEGEAPAAAASTFEEEITTAPEVASSHGTITIAQFEANVGSAADEMIRQLAEFNRDQENPEQALRSAASLRPRWMRYFRRLLSAEFELATPAEQEPIIVKNS